MQTDWDELAVEHGSLSFQTARADVHQQNTRFPAIRNALVVSNITFFVPEKIAWWSWSQMIDIHWNMSAGIHRVCSEHFSRLESNHKFVCQVEICWVSMVERLDLLSTHNWTMHTNQHCEPCIFIGSLAMDAFIRHCFNEICPHANYPDRFDLMPLSFEWTPLLRCRRYASGAGREKNVPWRLRIDKPSCWKVGASASMDWKVDAQLREIKMN